MPSTKLPTSVAKSGPEPLRIPRASAKAPVPITCAGYILIIGCILLYMTELWQV